MFTIIDQSTAVELEYQVRRLYRCDRSGVSGLAEADYLRKKPIQAAVLIVAYIYANHLENDPYQYDEFLSKYETIFESPDEYDIETETRNYVNELRSIVGRYIQ